MRKTKTKTKTKLRPNMSPVAASCDSHSTTAAPTNGKIVDNNARVAHRYYEMLKILDISRDVLNGTNPEEAREIIEERISVLRQERTDTEILMSHPLKTVSLAGKKYDFDPKTLLKNVEWRRKCSRLMEDAVKNIVKKARPVKKDDSEGENEVKDSDGLKDVISKEIKGSKDDTKIKDSDDLKVVIEKVSKSSGIDMASLATECVEYIFCEGLDNLVDLMFTYSEELKEDEKEIRENADPCEIADAAMEAFSISIPFAKTVFRGYYRLSKSAGLVEMLAQKIKV